MKLSVGMYTNGVNGVLTCPLAYPPLHSYSRQIGAGTSRITQNQEQRKTADRDLMGMGGGKKGIVSDSRSQSVCLTWQPEEAYSDR